MVNTVVPTDNLDAVVAYYKASHKSYVRVWSGIYDRAIHFGYYDNEATTHPEALIRMNEILSELVEIDREDVVIDAGCGFGGSTVWLAENRAGKAIGVNIVPHQIAIANGVAQDRVVADRVSFLEADFANIPVKDETADVFWALESMVHAPDRSLVLAEAFRLLKPGGRIMIVEYCLRSEPPLDVASIPQYEEILSGWAMPSLLTIPDYVSLISAAGFSGIRPQVLTDWVVPSLRRMKRLAGASLIVTRLLAALGLYDRARVAHAQASVALADAHFAGHFHYAVITAQKPAAIAGVARSGGPQ
jgi:ubiquinone/menaquinone biosynthesis C-methylase UbiE